MTTHVSDKNSENFKKKGKQTMSENHEIWQDIIITYLEAVEN
jgi:hypothetical protein